MKKSTTKVLLILYAMLEMSSEIYFCKMRICYTPFSQYNIKQ